MGRVVAKGFQPVDRSQSRRTFLFTSTLVGASVVTAFGSRWETTEGRWSYVLFFLVLSLAAELLTVELPEGKGRVSVGFATSLGAILVLEPHEAALVAAGGAFFANVLQRRSVDIIFFNASQLWLTALATAHAWQALTPAESLPPVASGAFAGLLWRLGVCALLYLALNLSLVSVSLRLAYGTWPRDLLAKNALWGIANFIALGSLGLLIAVLYLHVGAFGVVLLWIPILLARYSLQQSVVTRTAHLEIIQALARAIDAKDPYTRGHSERVAEYAAEIGAQMKLPASEIEMLRHAGILHDIGKIGISDTVLNKTGRLTDIEFQLIKTHTVIGAHVVKPVGFLRGVSQVIRHHHERYDGRGYPDGLKGEEIPLAARILAVADAFDAMTYDRVYRAGMEPDEAVAELMKGRGTQFDPNIVDIFVRRVLPLKIELTRDSSAQRWKERADARGDQVWRRLVDERDQDQAGGAGNGG